MIRVLFFIHDLSGGGAEKVLVNLINNIDKSKFKVTLLTMFDNGVNKQYLKPDIEYKYVFKRVFRGNQHLLKFFPPKFLYKKMVQGNYDIIISFMQGATTRVISGCSNTDVLKINWVHTEMTKQKLAHSYRNYKEFEECYKRYDATVFVADTAKKIFERETKLNNNHFVKYNTIEVDEIFNKSYEEINETIFDEKVLNLVSIGRLTKAKGYDRLLKVINKIVKEDYQIHLYIIGDGVQRRELEDYIYNHKLSDYVSLLGYKNNPYKYLRNADLFVCSSYYEGYSTVVTESLIVGTPVITTLCSGMEEMLGSNSEYGVIVENSEDGLYDGLLKLLNNEEHIKHYKNKAKERSKYFNTKTTVYEVEKLLVNLYGEKSLIDEVV